jgi:CheY-like chemotaxis protein
MGHGLPPTIYTDVTRLQQILKNLLANAFKFTEKGSVTLMVDARAPRGEAAPLLAFSVRDTGIGIAHDKQKIIFEAFQQADGTTSRKYGGTGLGLTISREIARLLGGTIDVESAPGAGSVFTVLVPQRYVGPEPARELDLHRAELDDDRFPPVGSGPDLSGHTVLLADDDMRNLFAINAVLESAKLRVIHAQNGVDAVRLLRENPHVDLVLMDTMMPEMDGLSAIREIRSDARFETLPIVSLTAKAMKGDRESAIAAGASDYVPKPVDPDRLLAVVHHWLVDPGVLAGGAATAPEPQRAGMQ